MGRIATTRTRWGRIHTGTIRGGLWLWVLALLLVSPVCWGATVEQFVAFGTAGVTVDHNSQVRSGDIGTNGKVSFAHHVRVHGNVFGNTVVAGSQTLVTGDVHYNTSQAARSVMVQGDRVTPLALPVLSTLPPLPVVSPGSRNVLAGWRDKVTLKPGAYNYVFIGPHSTVIFTGGTYHIRRLVITYDARVTFLAPTVVNVAKQLDVHGRGRYVGAPGVQANEVIFNFAGTLPVRIGRDSVFRANLLALYSTIVLEPHVVLTGAVLGREVKIDHHAVLQLRSAFAVPSGGSVAVPNVVGLEEAEAAAALTAAQLNVGTITTAHSATVPAGQVVSQSPVAGTAVPPGSAVDLVVSLGLAPVPVPDVVGLAQAAAEAVVGAVGLAVGSITTTHSATVPAGLMVSQSPVAGTAVPPGSAVDLVVSLGPPLVSVPAVVGLTQAEAEAAIEAATLTVGTITTAHSPTVPAGVVISQQPGAGTLITTGAPMDFVVSLGAADTTPPVVAITDPSDGSVVNRSPVTVMGIVDDATATVVVNGVPATVSAGTFTATGVPFQEGSNTLTATATDPGGNVGTASVQVTLDATLPVVAITAPADQSVVPTPSVTVNGTVDDATVTVAVNGVAVTVTPGSPAQFTTTVDLQEGSNLLTATATDVAGNAGTASVTVTRQTLPVVTITAPANLSYVNISPTTVTGTVDNPTATVTVNAIAAAVVNGSFSVALPLAEGPNLVTVTATTPSGAVGVHSIQVTLDTTPPRVTITSPPDQFVTMDSTITVAGSVNDIVVGTVNDQQAQVTVNGTAAQVANRTFLATEVPLVLGSNVIQAVGRDRVGNAATTQITVMRQAPGQQARIQMVSGNHQSGVIGSLLPETLVVALTDATGDPVPDKPVIFKVTQNDGMVAAGGPSVTSVIATTNAQGQAQVQWTLGARAGAGANAVEAYAVGFEGTALFTATGTQGPAGKIVVDSGNDQIGAVNQPLPRPLIAVVVDSGNNRLASVPVTFTVIQGGGSVAGQSNPSGVPVAFTVSQDGNSVASQPSVTVTTDSDGRAAATLTLGSLAGNANNRVQVDFPSNPGHPVSFTASGRVSGDPAHTTISGIVLDNSNVPIPGVIIRAVLTNVLNSNVSALQAVAAVQTDAQGQFSILQAPVGFVKLVMDGSTAELPGQYPSLDYDLVTVAGQNNTVGMPIYLLPLNTSNQLCVTATTGGGTLTIPEAPGFSLTFGPGQVTFPGGSKTGCVSVTVVHGDKVPMVPGFGQQPRFIVTIQPAGAVFNPPAPITLPNVDGLKPRAVTEMYSFDHDISSFVAIGTGVVSNDGQVIRSSPGVGVLKAGWHCGGNPETTGQCESCRISLAVTTNAGTFQASMLTQVPAAALASEATVTAMGNSSSYTFSVRGSLSVVAQSPTSVTLGGTGIGTVTAVGSAVNSAFGCFAKTIIEISEADCDAICRVIMEIKEEIFDLQSQIEDKINERDRLQRDDLVACAILRAQKARLEIEKAAIMSRLAAFFEALTGQELALSACLLAPPVTGCNQIQQAIAITRSHIAEEQIALSMKQAQINQINMQLAALRCGDIEDRIEQLTEEIQILSDMIEVKFDELALWENLLRRDCGIEPSDCR